MPHKEQDPRYESKRNDACADPWLIALGRRLRVETIDEPLKDLRMRDSPPSRLFRPPGGSFWWLWENRAPLAVQLGLIYGNPPPENPRRFVRRPAPSWALRQGSIAPVDASPIPGPLL